MALFQQIAAPAQDGVRTDEESQSAQDLAGHRCQEVGQEGAIRGSELHLGVAELPFNNVIWCAGQGSIPSYDLRTTPRQLTDFTRRATLS